MQFGGNLFGFKRFGAHVLAVCLLLACATFGLGAAYGADGSGSAIPSVVIEQVIPITGNNPWNAQSPLSATGAARPPVTTGCTTPQPASVTQGLACPAGQTGAIVQNQTYSCVGGDWIPGEFRTLSNTCSPAQTGCATNFSGGSYACSGSCGIASTALTVTAGSAGMTANPFGSNGSAAFSCAGAAASSQSGAMIILGASGYRCTLTGTSTSSFGMLCQNNAGGSCTASCSR